MSGRKSAKRRDLAVDPRTIATGEKSKGAQPSGRFSESSSNASKRSEPADSKTVKRPEGRAPQSSQTGKRRFCGLLQRKEKWVLSWRGRFVVWGGLAVLGIIFILKVHPFLAVTEPVDSQYLVIEGWVPNYAVQEGMDEFRSKSYVKMFTVGADPLTGTNIMAGDSIAFACAGRLKWLGMDMNLVQAVPAHIKYRNRTFESAVALRKWIEENHEPVTSFNLLTLGPHARRSRLLFEEAFEGKARVGIISVTNREYDPGRWWKYSEGVKEVIGEGVGYGYARFIFHPGKNDNN